MKRIISLAITALTLMPGVTTAQEKVEADISATLVSDYMWRGLNLANISLQPQISVAWQGLSILACANTGIDRDDLRDLDITLNYTRWGFNIGVTDYFCYNVDSKNRFFHYSGGVENPHQLEANLGYTCKYGSIMAHTMFYGNDYKIDGNRAYSTFIELNIPFRAAGLDWNIMAGATPFESSGYSYEEQITTDTGKTKTVTRGEWMYGEKFTCNMLALRATKHLEFKHCRVPIFVEFHSNPYLQRANLLLGISIATL